MKPISALPELLQLIACLCCLMLPGRCVLAADTSAIMKHYEAAARAEVPDPAFWDSLAKEAAALHRTDVELYAIDRKGLTLRVKGMIPEAVATYELCATRALKEQQPDALFSALHHLAYHYFIQNELNTALDYYYKALHVAEQNGNKRQLITLKILLGHIYFRACKPKAALAVHTESLRMAREGGYREEMVKALMGMGNAYHDFGERRKGATYYFEAAKLAEGLHVSALRGQVYNALGSAYAAENLHDSAEKYYLKAYNLFASLRHTPGTASSLACLAQSAYAQKHYALAERYALQAVEQAQTTGFGGQILSLSLLLRDIYQTKGNYRDALKYYELYSAAHDSVTQNEIAAQALAQQYDYDLEKKEHDNQLLGLRLRHERRFTAGIIAVALLVLMSSALLILQYTARNRQRQTRLELQLLRSQMNPHFIFNALQAIQNLALHRDERKTVKYLSSFAHLTRNVLDSSGMELITLAKETELLRTYLDLQKLRFGERFEYYITIDERIDLHLNGIPPMLCQPFIENAVEHGMRDLTYGGEIHINYTVDGKDLLITITDNGRGIGTADTKAGEHRSRAIHITRQRIALLNKSGKAQISFLMGDAFPHGAYKGVKVAFRFSGSIIFTAHA